MRPGILSMPRHCKPDRIVYLYVKGAKRAKRGKTVKGVKNMQLGREIWQRVSEKPWVCEKERKRRKIKDRKL